MVFKQCFGNSQSCATKAANTCPMVPRTQDVLNAAVRMQSEKKRPTYSPQHAVCLATAGRRTNEVIDQRRTMSVGTAAQPLQLCIAGQMRSSTLYRYIHGACSDKLPSDRLHWSCADYRHRKHGRYYQFCGIVCVFGHAAR